MVMGLLLLLVVGLLLLMAEVFLVPGVTFVGLAGLLLMAIGVGLAYTEFGQPTGHIVLIVTLLLSGIILFRAFRSGFWGAFALKSTLVDARAPEPGGVDAGHSLRPGMKARAVSRLRPMGMAEIQGEIREVELSDGWAEPGDELVVTRVEFHKIFVQLNPSTPPSHV